MLGKDSEDRTVVGGRFADWTFPADLFDLPPQRLLGVACPVLSPAALLGSKADFPIHPYGAPLRAKDQQDIDALLAHIARGGDDSL
jgi:hypothetical protein